MMVLTTIGDASRRHRLEIRRPGSNPALAPGIIHIAIGTNQYLVAITALGTMVLRISVAAWQPATGQQKRGSLIGCFFCRTMRPVSRALHFLVEWE
jgi:hypothetical protein